MKTRCILFIKACVLMISVLSAQSLSAKSIVESALDDVDSHIARSAEFESKKLQRIEYVKSDLSRATDNLRRYELNRSLFLEYESLVCDSALRYINDNIELAVEIGRDDLLAESKIDKATVISKAGLFNETLSLLSSIDPSTLSREQKARYYLCYNDVYQFLIEYEGGGEFSKEYRRMTNAYKDSILKYEDPTSFYTILESGSRMIDNDDYDGGIAVLIDNLDNYQTGSREYSIIASVLAYAYHQLGQSDKEIEYYSKAAVSDIRGVIKENMATRALAEAVFARGDINRANHYIQKSIDDANYYSARMRKNQSALMLPLVTRTFQVAQNEQSRELRLFLILTAVLALGFIIACVLVIRQLKTVKASHRIVSDSKDVLQKLNTELSQANHAYESANAELSEANVIKEEYIGRFLELCSNYISTLEQYRKMLYQQAASGKIEDLYRSLKSQKFINETLADFYKSFDTAFLNIFPDFVERVNELLPEGGKIHLKSDEQLNTELRILALVRLGINDSAKIANFLRCSITTVYTYRSKVKNRSISKIDFEREVMKIPSF